LALPAGSAASGTGRTRGGQVPVEGDAAVGGEEQHGQGEAAGQQELQVGMGRPGERVAEQVGEHQREQQRDPITSASCSGTCLIFSRGPFVIG